MFTKKSSPKFKRHTLLQSKAALVVILAVFVTAGVALLLHSHAATAYIVVEPENGYKTGNVSAGDTADASGGASIKYGAKASNILFEDDFNGATGSKADQSKWGEYSACGYNGSAAYGNIKCGQDETLDGQGHLIIPATPTRGQSLMTGDKFRFEYGTMSAWIKMPSQPGYWPAFWTLNNNVKGAELPMLGEIDVNETYTTWLDGYHAGVHNWSAANQSLTTSGGPDLISLPGKDVSAAYHKYTAKVEPNKITFYYDDVQQGKPFTPADNPGKPWGFGPNVHDGNWLILTLAIGGAGGQQKPATQNAQMLVDRVEVRAN